MTTADHRFIFLAALLCLGIASLNAQTVSNQGPSAVNPAHDIPTPEPPPNLKSPVEFFRELLSMDVAERHEALADRSPENRKLVLAKIRQYESLNADQREFRLRVTELRWYLLPLMKTPATNRTAQLEIIPPEMRKLVEDRLRDWDKLPANLQKDLLDNEATMRYLTEIKGASEDERRRMLATLSEARREMLLAGLDRWGAMSEAERLRTANRFEQFFELTESEKARALDSLSEPERKQMEKTLRTYSTLTSAQRAQCIKSFEKFANLSLTDRQQFLKNAELWKLMKPAERQSWRQLVNQLPLLPPEVEMPPQPHDPRRIQRPLQASSTNR